ncbi:MAG TPA: hypothetical protein VGJ31_04075, partial [Dongiaceae bacterium]
MRIGHVSAAIGLSAAVVSGLLLSAPAVEPLQPAAARLDAMTVNEARHHRDQSFEDQQAGNRQMQPLLAAIAQVNYDCWAEALPRPKGAPMSAECHQRFLQAFEGMPDNDHRWPIPSVEPGQFDAATSGDTPATESPPAQHDNDSIGALILSLSSPSLARRGATHNSALASVHAVGQQPPDGQKNGQLMGSCDANCLAMSFSGPGAAPLIGDHDRNFRGAGDSNAGGTDSSPGNNGPSNNGPGGGGVGSGGSGSGSGGSGSPGGGRSGRG